MSISKEIILKTIPEKPGVYQFINKDQTIIYVGKAKNLKKRVSSYFQKNIKNNTYLFTNIFTDFMGRHFLCF